MKTLYININNEQIQSNEELEVLDYDLDSDFFFYLGEKIAKGCRVENENALITDFNTLDTAEDYQKIIAQWNEIKTILFSEECERLFELTLPSSYIHWLRYSDKYNHVYDKNFSHGETLVISIDLEELYEDVEALQRKILRTLKQNELHVEVDEIVFNDYAITRSSKIKNVIKERYSEISFIPFQKFINNNKRRNAIKEINETVNISQNTEESPESNFPEYRTFRAKGVEFRMRYVKAGVFKNSDGENVRLTNDFYIGETPVTQELWTAIMGKNPSGNQECDRKTPIVRVSYIDCTYFIKKLNDISGLCFKLPTVAQWELAAKEAENSLNFNMKGNIAEWCSDKMGPFKTDLDELKYYEQWKDGYLVNPERSYNVFFYEEYYRDCAYALSGSFYNQNTSYDSGNIKEKHSAFKNVGLRLILEQTNEDFLSSLNGIRLGNTRINDIDSTFTEISNNIYRKNGINFIANGITKIFTLMEFGSDIPTIWREHLNWNEETTYGELIDSLKSRGWIFVDNEIKSSHKKLGLYLLAGNTNFIYSTICPVCGSTEYEIIGRGNRQTFNAICRKCNNKFWDIKL